MTGPPRDLFALYDGPASAMQGRRRGSTSCWVCEVRALGGARAASGCGGTPGGRSGALGRGGRWMTQRRTKSPALPLSRGGPGRDRGRRGEEGFPKKPVTIRRLVHTGQGRDAQARLGTEMARGVRSLPRARKAGEGGARVPARRARLGVRRGPPRDPRMGARRATSRRVRARPAARRGQPHPACAPCHAGRAPKWPTNQGRQSGRLIKGAKVAD